MVSRINKLQELINDLSVLQWQLQYHGDSKLTKDEQEFFIKRLDDAKDNIKKLRVIYEYDKDYN